MATTHHDSGNAAMLAELARLRAENAALKAAPTQKIVYKISQSGAVSFYGFGRFPFTAYWNAVLWILDRADEIRAWGGERFQRDASAKGGWSLTKLGEMEREMAEEKSKENEAKRKA